MQENVLQLYTWNALHGKEDYIRGKQTMLASVVRPSSELFPTVRTRLNLPPSHALYFSSSPHVLHTREENQVDTNRDLQSSQQNYDLYVHNNGVKPIP